MTSIYDRDLARSSANHQPLTPLSFLERSAQAFPEHPAIIHEGPRASQRYSYAEFYAAARRLASALRGRGIGRGDTVAARSTGCAGRLPSVCPVNVGHAPGGVVPQPG